MSAKSAATVRKTWETTSVQGIYRHKTGKLYLRTYSQGKECWRSLKTPLIEIAKERAREHRGTFQKQVQAQAAAEAGRMLISDCIQLFRKRIESGWSFRSRGRGNRTKKRNQESTTRYRNQTLAALLKSWPQLSEMDVRKVSRDACEKWADKYVQQISPSRFNATLDTLRFIFDEAVSANARGDNPAAGLARSAVLPKQLALPSSAQFHSFIKEIETAGGRFSRDCTDFVQFLAYTGARKTEATFVQWSDVEFGGQFIILRKTKNGLERRVPMIAEAKKLLQVMRERRMEEPLTASVVRVQEAQKAMDSAAKKVGMQRITHHDLRHLFATVCIESGVDIPTVSRWLGHQDGGALAMRTYGHLRDEHSQRAAEKVTFGKSGGDSVRRQLAA